MGGELDPILGDLERHAALFDLTRDGLGRSAIERGSAGVLAHFDAQVDPEGNPWDELSARYARWKARHYPGKPILVREGLLRADLAASAKVGEVTRDRAEWVAGMSDEGRAELSYAEEGDPETNRPPRKVADLNAGSIAELDQLFDERFRS